MKKVKTIQPVMVIKSDDRYKRIKLDLEQGFQSAKIKRYGCFIVLILIVLTILSLIERKKLNLKIRKCSQN